MGAKPTPSTSTEIVSIPLKDLVQDLTYSGRSESEIKKNAVELRPMIANHGGWDISQPGQFFVRGGKKYLRAGFTRAKACELAGVKSGYFVEVPDDPDAHRTACILTNEGKTISALSQGKLFMEMEEGTDVAKAKKGDPVFEPMKRKEIANKVGKTEPWIARCIGVAKFAKDAPEIAQMIESDQIAAQVAEAAVKAAPEDRDKQLKMVRAAVKKANDDGKDTATMKHFDAIKDQFAPKLRAVSGNGQTTSAPPVAATDVDPASGASGPDSVDPEPEEPESPTAPKPPQPQSVLNLGTPAPSKKEQKKTRAETVEFIRDAIIAALEGFKVGKDYDETPVLDDDEAERLADYLVSKGVGCLPESPI